jgi:hypothetical protein
MVHNLWLREFWLQPMVAWCPPIYHPPSTFSIESPVITPSTIDETWRPSTIHHPPSRLVCGRAQKNQELVLYQYLIYLTYILSKILRIPSNINNLS